MRWKTLVLRLSLVTVLVGVAGAALSPFVQVPSPPWWVLVPLIAAALVLAPLSMAARAGATAALRPARVDVRKDGSFEFHPANEPQPDPRLYATQGMHADPAASHVVRLLTFEVRDEEPAAKVRRAIEKATSRATAALPGTGKVRAQAHERDVAGPTSRLVVKLTVEGPGADAAWADAAEAAFRAEMTRRLKG